jgi:hypothetical protein
MASDPLTDDQLDDLAERVADRLPPGSYGDRVVLTRRQLVAAATGTLSTGALISLGVDPAAAQAAGQVGTTSDPVDVVAYSVQDRSGSTMALEVVASGSVTLSSGSATVTVESASGTTYYLALGTDQNAKVSGRVYDDGNVTVEIVETGTSVGNPTVEYDVVQVR